MSTKIRLFGIFSILFGSFGIIMLGFFWFPSVFPRAATPLRNPTQVSLKSHRVAVDQKIRKQLITKNKKIKALIFMERPTGIAKVTTRQNKRGSERKNYYTNLRQKTNLIQNAVLTKTNTLVRSGHMSVKKQFFVDNVMLVEINETALNALTKTPGILSIIPDAQIQVPPLTQATLTAPPEWNLTKIGAERVWDELGITGQGVVVANIDTGVQWEHPALKSKYRGWNGTSASHDYNWYDPSNTSRLTPLDNNGHGTHTMGTIVGSDDTHTIGVAPDAKWIAVKGCASNFCNQSDLLAAGQWLLAPTKLDGTNPDPTRAPDIISNSWGGQACQPWFSGVVDSWNSAGIFSDFSAGNTGPNASTIGTPADYSQSFSVGAVDVNDVVANFSSRGPACATFGGNIKPDVVAPGVSILSSIPNNNYLALNGTSMASPHVAGVAALLLQYKPTLLPHEIAYTIKSTTTDLGTTGLDNTYGAGLINAYKALTLSSGVIPTPTPSSAPTPTPSPNPIPHLTILAPNGGETYQENQLIQITWDAVDVAFVDVFLTTGTTNTVVQKIATDVQRNQSVQWIVNKYGNSNSLFKIKVVGQRTNPWATDFVDYSDNSFTITAGPTPTPTVTPTPFTTPTPTVSNTPTPTTSPIPTPTPTTPTPTRTPTPTTSPMPTSIACIPADINKSGTVDGNDLGIIFTNIFKTNPTPARADINKDGIVDLTDYSILVRDYNMSTGACL